MIPWHIEIDEAADGSWNVDVIIDDRIRYSIRSSPDLGAAVGVAVAYVRKHIAEQGAIPTTIREGDTEPLPIIEGESWGAQQIIDLGGDVPTPRAVERLAVWPPFDDDEGPGNDLRKLSGEFEASKTLVDRLPDDDFRTEMADANDAADAARKDKP